MNLLTTDSDVPIGPAIPEGGLEDRLSDPSFD